MTTQDTELLHARARLDSAEMLSNFASYQHELLLRKSWMQGVLDFFTDQPGANQFSWEQYTDRDGAFFCDPNGVKVDSDHFAYKDAVELLSFFKGSELRLLFGNFVKVTIRRDGLVKLDVAEDR